MSEFDPFKVFLELQLGLPRNGPGSRAATEAAFAMLPALPEKPEIADLGCGQGASTFELLRLTKGRVTAVDLFEPFLEKLGERAEEEGIGEERLVIMRGDMTALSFRDASFDLIWSEGAIYLLGFEHGLETWARFVKKDGFVAVSECTWLTATPSDEARVFWEEAYPSMGTIASNCEAAVRAGFEIVGTHVLTDEDWRAAYYSPMQARIAEMRETWGEEVEGVLSEAEAEIALFENNPGQYSYVFYVLRRKD
ncbi:class I SAM-dependent methyltransferase [Parvibaculum sp.]|uniref:class I SAM-dependent methyltransferase n=1 Tax=Parvibaculum sp. TaxID=2024848 RepID=UPI001B1CDDB1|nr:class I SAM-dependent methyltransferase [Parvibaculum sp.]MBO6633576.1 methyltransferase domain-containing protein [Parvibaculum sp.]MBO6678434.1 methyltransferase domain-containing protein [Parvibaculum sp.]MBO6684023.1 methyltransferase domain-containing protein [Parvibaculum sp.]